MKFILSKLTHKSESESGATMVEMAIAMPLFALILFGILQWGVIFAAHITVRNASAIGAREAVLQGGDPSTGQTVCRNSLASALDPNRGSCQGLPLTTGPLSGAVQMTATYDLPLFASFVVPSSNGGVLRLSSSSFMR